MTILTKNVFSASCGNPRRALGQRNEYSHSLLLRLFSSKTLKADRVSQSTAKTISNYFHFLRKLHFLITRRVRRTTKGKGVLELQSWRSDKDNPRIIIWFCESRLRSGWQWQWWSVTLVTLQLHRAFCSYYLSSSAEYEFYKLVLFPFPASMKLKCDQ